jgi:hypothetical protein
MTEAEWLESPWPDHLLEFLPAEAGERKFHLVVCAFQRRMKPELAPWIEDVERNLDGLPVQQAWEEQEDPHRGHCRFEVKGVRPSVSGWDHVERIIHPLVNFPFRPRWVCDYTQLVADLLRDIFGNPFRPVPIDPAWLTSKVIAIAHGIYDGHAFDRMPILAEALEAAGCTNAEVLAHCRGSGPHARGCWVVDRLTGKS